MIFSTHVTSNARAQLPYVHPFTASTIFKDGGISLVQAAQLSHCTLQEFIKYLKIRKIPVVDMTEAECVKELQVVEALLAGRL